MPSVVFFNIYMNENMFHSVSKDKEFITLKIWPRTIICELGHRSNLRMTIHHLHITGNKTAFSC